YIYHSHTPSTLISFPTRRSSDLSFLFDIAVICSTDCGLTPISARVELSSAGSTIERQDWTTEMLAKIQRVNYRILPDTPVASPRSEEHTSELQSQSNLVCRLLLE